MRQKRFAAVLLFALLALASAAQEQKPVIQLNPFFIEGMGLEESRFIESLVLSYLSDIGLLEDDSFDSRPPDFTINGNIRLERDGHILTLEIVNAKTSQSFSFTAIYKTAGELALKTRSMLESVFSTGGLETEKKPTADPEALSENLVWGTWKGEAGIEMIRLQRGGRGVAIFSSGAQMVLSYTIQDNVLKVTQVSPNQERFYYPLPQDVARQIAAAAEPVIWELSLYQRGNILSGVKLSTGVRMENGTVAELLPAGDVREVVWIKSH